MNARFRCNKCGRDLKMQGSIPVEDYILVNKQWGYFSKKDGKTYRFIICEECSDKIFGGFEVPVDISDTTELL